MAIQTQMYQDYCSMNTINNNMDNNMYNQLVFNLQQKQQLQQQQQQCLFQFPGLQNPSLGCYNGFVNNITPTGSCTTASVDQTPHGFDNYSQEIDRYIVSQNERLRVALQGQTKKQMGEMWRKLQEKGMMIMEQKKQEIGKARLKTRELEERMTKLELEKQAWKGMAIENESMVISLNNTLEQVKQQMNNTSDAESCCDENEDGRVIRCKVCRRSEASVVLLPCRHLSCCVACNTCVHECPLCHSIKKASIQALFS